MSPPGSPKFQSNVGPEINSNSDSDDNLESLLRTNLDCPDDGYGDLVLRRQNWWDSSRLRGWLRKKNYELYENRFGDSAVVYPTNVVPQHNQFPFAYHDPPSRAEENDDPPFMANTGVRGIVGYAQDASGRHVVIKAILRDSKEKEILEYLRNEYFPKSIDEFRNVLPVLDIIGCEGHWLAITPRWGDEPLGPRCANMKQVFHFIRCLLNGLSFLHEHRITHADIRLDNILINHTQAWMHDMVNDRRSSLRIEGKLTYALFDFSHARQFPRSTKIENCRLPSELSFATWQDQRPPDTHQGELDFNPFAFDVGMLGILFCREFQNFIPIAPMLAPLLDKMTTRDILRRFTASEALTFLNEHVDPLTISQDREIRGIPRDVYFESHDTYDRWKGLDPTFVAQWSAYREPPIPWSVQLLRKLCDNDWGCRLVLLVRQTCRSIRCFPQYIFNFVNTSQ